MIHLPKPARRFSDPRVYVVGFMPYPESDEHTRLTHERYYIALIDAYQVGVQLFPDGPGELAFKNAPLISIEERSNHPDQVNLRDFAHPADGIYLVGNSLYRWPSGHFDVDYRVYIETPGFNKPLYGSQAAAIVLQHRSDQHASL